MIVISSYSDYPLSMRHEASLVQSTFGNPTTLEPGGIRFQSCGLECRKGGSGWNR